VFQEALTAADAGDWATACPKFRASHEAAPSVGALLNMASCSERDGKLLRAKAEYLEVLRSNESTADVARKEAVRSRAQQGIAALDQRLPRLRISASPSTARIRISVDGQLTEMSGDGIAVDPGAHALRIEADGFVSVNQHVVAEESRPLDVAITLTPLSRATPPSSMPAETTTAQPPAEAAGTSLPLIGGIVTGVGVGIAALSAIPLVAASKKAKEIRALCGDAAAPPNCVEGSAQDAQRATELSDEGEPLAIVGYVLIGVGGAAVATGLALIVAGVSDDAAPTVGGFVPVLGPREVGLCFETTF
jgi:hypothetical protein